MKKFWKIFGITTLAQIIQWLLLIRADYIEERNYITSSPYGGIPFFEVLIFPIVLSIIYILYESDKNESQKIKRFIMTSVIWIVETACISGYIIELINKGKWFIVQGGGEYGVPAMDLNGIEYGLLPMYWGIIPIIIVLSCKLIGFIYNKIKAQLS